MNRLNNKATIPYFCITYYLLSLDDILWFIDLLKATAIDLLLCSSIRVKGLTAPHIIESILKVLHTDHALDHLSTLQYSKESEP